MVTTWACLAEAMHLAYGIGRWQAQSALWRLVEADIVQLHAPRDYERIRMFSLMESYRDTPMDLADASLVTAAEALGLTQIFTLDSDFHFYRIGGRTPFEVIP